MTAEVSAPREVPCLISERQIAERVEELAQRISADYAGRQPLLVGVLKAPGSSWPISSVS